jgi:hypothetical protein
VATSDAEAARIVEEATANGVAPPPIRLGGGDLWRTCGGSGVRDPGTGGRDGAVLEVDVGVARLDGRARVFVAHAVARGRSWWLGPVVAVANAEYLDGWDVAPRGHPADGLLDVFEVAAMTLTDRWKVRQRMVSGSHLPHPAIAARRASEATFTFDRPRRVWLDGVPVGSARELAVRLEPRALTIFV